MAECTQRSSRPVIVIPARFSATASALRYRAVVAARALADAVYAAGGDPWIMHPHAPGAQISYDEVRTRMCIADAVLLPGGGDLDPRWSDQVPHPSQYDVEPEQDAFDLAVARVALDDGLPTLAICRGLQVVNVLLGGDIVQDMTIAGAGDHRHRRHRIFPALSAGLPTPPGGLEISCYHHQCLGRLGAGLEVVARSEDGIIEAARLAVPAVANAWFLGVQWHPEDTAATDVNQALIFDGFVSAACR